MLLNSQLLYFLFISGLNLFLLGSSEFHFIDMSKTYEDAKSYCREMYTDLATIHNITEQNDLIKLATNRAPWIGLEIANRRMWHWSLPGHTVEYTNWSEGNPQENDIDACGAMDESGKWFENDCRTKRSFVCHSDIGSHIFVAATKTWRDAQNHCRNISTDLVHILSAEENEAVRLISQNSWIGLFKDPWKWSDGSNSSFRYWGNSQPNYLVGQECTVTVFKNSRKWNDVKCTGNRKIICQGAYKVPTTTIQTSTPDSTEETNLTTVSNITSESFIVTYHFTVDTNDTNETNSTTTPNTTVSPATALTTIPVTINGTNSTTTPNTTVSPATALTTIPVTINGTNSTTTPNTTVSPATALTTIPVTINGTNMTTIPVTTESTSALPNTTRLVTLPLHSNTPGNLVLIRQNFTWIEAIAFCRSHYIDLVHISTEDVQKEVAEKVKNATTPHVWIGLKYTCSSNIWFWTKSSSGCYQNWAPQQGSARNYSCGVTGAIEATGGQQWVGLPQTEKLNFICNACTG